MHKLLSIAVLLLAGCGGKVTFHTPTTVHVKIPWTVTKKCDKCAATVYRMVGQCDLKGQWEIVGTTKANQFIDSTALTDTTYSYDVELFSGNDFSGPSNCQTITTGATF